MCMKLTPKQLYSTLQKVTEARIPVFVWGAPGIGKSAITRQVAEKRKIEFIDLRVAQLDPTDLRGLPAIKGDRAIWLPPVFLPQVEKDGEKGILFLDELNVAPPLIQAASYQLILDRRIGEYSLPENWAVVAAGNRMEDATVTFQMPVALRNRFLHLELEPNLEDWKEWAFKNDIDTRIIAFLNFRPELLFKFNKDENTFPTPRSWEYCSRALKAGVDLEIAVSSTVGEGVMAEFITFLNIYKDLPSPSQILSQHITFKEPSRMYAVCGMLIRYAKSQGDCKEKLLDYILNIDRREFSILLARDALKSGILLRTCNRWRDFCHKFQHLIL